MRKQPRFSLIRKIQTFLALGQAVINPEPIIVLGHQKSGTSAIAALLAKAAGKTATIDFFYKNNHTMPFFREQLHQGKLPLTHFLSKNRQYLSTDIIKEPELTYLYDQLQSRFPKATYVFVVREPKSTLKSVLDRLKLPGHMPRLSKAQYEQVNPLSGWLPALEGKAPKTPGATYIERLAHRWNRATQTYLDDKGQMVLIRYEDFLADKQNSIYSLANRTGLAVVVDISDALNVQFQPKGNRHVATAEFFGKQNKATIDSICREQALQFGYKI